MGDSPNRRTRAALTGSDSCTQLVAALGAQGLPFFVPARYWRSPVLSGGVVTLSILDQLFLYAGGEIFTLLGDDQPTAVDATGSFAFDW